MSAGRLIRQAALHERLDQPCPTCGHPLSEHRERRPEEPGYAPLRFFCHAEGCNCVRQERVG